MKRHLKILFISLILGGLAFSSFADRGVGKKKNKVKLNITTTESGFKNSLAFNLKTGLQYTGSLLAQPTISNPHPSIYLPNNQLITYQKGNSIYIVPFKQKVLVTENRQGYAGLKLIIKAS